MNANKTEKLFYLKANIIYLNVKHNNLSDFTFLNSLTNLDELDLSENIDADLSTIVVKTLRVQRSGLKSLERIDFNVFQQIEYLDVSYNQLSSIPYIKISSSLNDQIQYYFSQSIRFIDFSFNKISMINNSLFRDKSHLSYIGLEKCFTSKLKDFLFYFNDNLKSIRLSENYLNNFPVFCSSYSLTRICLFESLDLKSNRFVNIFLKDLLYLNNLKNLNLENNTIASIQRGSFDSLTNLESFSLALNRISNLDNVDLFRNLLNLKELNLSSNFIEILNENLFKNLNKLVTLDLSSNRIFLVKNYSFNYLTNLISNRIMFLSPEKGSNFHTGVKTEK